MNNALILSRACFNASLVRRDSIESELARAFAHSCCEGGDCQCLCHYAETLKTSIPHLPAPVITHYPPDSRPISEYTG